MTVVLTVTIKGDDSTFKQKFLMYEDYMMSEKDDVFMTHVAEAISNSKIEMDGASITARSDKVMQ